MHSASAGTRPCFPEAARDLRYCWSLLSHTCVRAEASPLQLAASVGNEGLQWPCAARGYAVAQKVLQHTFAGKRGAGNGAEPGIGHAENVVSRMRATAGAQRDRFTLCERIQCERRAAGAPAVGGCCRAAPRGARGAVSRGQIELARPSGAPSHWRRPRGVRRAAGSSSPARQCCSGRVMFTA